MADPRLSAERRRALALLASSRHGANEELLVHGYGFSRRMLAGFGRAGLATWHHKTVIAGGRTIEVNYRMITGAGRRALEG
jgi:hypothetical protein